MDSPFTDAEKRFVLAEMIKVSHIDINALVNFVKSYDFQPDWFSMQLPNGRNMNQCMRAVQAMDMQHLQPPLMPPIKRKSLGDLNEQPPPKRLAIAPIESQPVPYARNIQPRPSPNGYSGPPPGLSPTTTPGSFQRKRGRPSKAEKQAQMANGPATLPPLLAPAPPPPVHQPPRAAHEYSPNPHPAYHMSPGPMDTKSKNGKKGKTPTMEKAQPRGLPGPPVTEYSERTPTLSNIMSAPIQSPYPRDSPAVHEAGRTLSGTILQPLAPRAPQAEMGHHSTDNKHAPVNTTA